MCIRDSCIGSIICIVAAIAGDTSQDLKTGFIVGATPKLQQIGDCLLYTSLLQKSYLYILAMPVRYQTHLHTFHEAPAHDQGP